VKLRPRVVLISLTLLLAVGAAAETASTPVWTDWYKKNLISALLELSNIRDQLYKNNIFSTYMTPPESRACTEHDQSARSADGMCNDFEQPWMGGAHTRFDRAVPLNEVHAETPSTGLLEPDPRLVSRVLLTREKFKPVENLNLLAATWIQFMVHDWVSHGENNDNLKKAYFLPIAKDDPFGQDFMVMLRTAADPSRTAADQGLPSTFENEVSSWWDGSQVYGSDLETQMKIRSMQGGKLKMDAEGHIPLDSDDVEVAGFKRNWWLGLSMMHHLFVNEHNKIAELLAQKHPEWDDQKLFDVARLINVAVMAKIHTVEWTPAVLNNPALKEAMHANWYGVLDRSKKTEPLWRTELEKIYDSPVLDGIVGGQKNLHGKPYSLSEEFTAVYRLHSLLPESLEIRDRNSQELLSDVPLAETRDARAHLYSRKYPLQDILYSLGVAHPGQLVLGNFPRFMQNLEVPIAGKIDLGAMDVFRDRERGVPRYNRFRKLLGLVPINSFDDLTDDQSAVQKIRSVYGTSNGHDNVDKLDLMIGTLAEGHRPTGFAFGETQFQEFILSASRRLQADRFFTTDYNATVYTQDGLDWVDRSSLKTVLLDMSPELEPYLKNLDSAFDPWPAQP
jgi:hypothetical protein